MHLSRYTSILFLKNYNLLYRILSLYEYRLVAETLQILLLLFSLSNSRRNYFHTENMRRHVAAAWKVLGEISIVRLELVTSISMNFFIKRLYFIPDNFEVTLKIIWTARVLKDWFPLSASIIKSCIKTDIRWIFLM